MAFPTGWARKVKITIPDIKISGSNTDFPILITEANLPTEMLDGGSNSALNGGGDVRVSEDSAGTIQLALEIVTFVTGGIPDVEIYTKLPTVNTGAAKDFYIWYKKIGEVQPAITAPFGRNAVWTDYASVLHLVESGSGVSGEFVDSSGNGVTGTVARGVSLQVSTAMPSGGTWQELDGADDFILLENSENLLDNSDITVSALWQNLSTLTNTDEGLISNRDSAQGNNFFQISPQINGSSGTNFLIHDGAGENLDFGAVIGVNNVVHSHLTANSGALRGYENGVEQAVDTTILSDNKFVTAKPITIGTYFDKSSGRSLHCRVGRVRLRKSVLSADWIATENNNQSAPATFATAGTPEAVDGDIDLNVTVSTVPLNISSSNTTVDLNVDSDITVAMDTLTLTPTNLTVDTSVDLDIIATSDSLNITVTPATIVTDIDQTVIVSSAVLNLTPVNPIVVLDAGIDINVSSVALSLSINNSIIGIDSVLLDGVITASTNTPIFAASTNTPTFTAESHTIIFTAESV